MRKKKKKTWKTSHAEGSEFFFHDPNSDFLQPTLFDRNEAFQSTKANNKTRKRERTEENSCSGLVNFFQYCEALSQSH